MRQILGSERSGTDAESRREIGGSGMLASQRDSVERNFRGHFGNSTSRSNPDWQDCAVLVQTGPLPSSIPFVLIGDRRSASRSSIVPVSAQFPRDQIPVPVTGQPCEFHALNGRADERRAAPAEAGSQSPARLPASARAVALAGDVMAVILDMFRIVEGLPLVGSGCETRQLRRPIRPRRPTQRLTTSSRRSRTHGPTRSAGISVLGTPTGVSSSEPAKSSGANSAKCTTRRRRPWSA